MMYALRAPSELGRLHDGALLDTGDTRGHADHHARFGEATLVDAVDEVAQHLLADLKVCDDAVLSGPNGLDVAGGAADHPFGLGAHGQRFAVFDVDGDHGGLVEDDAATSNVDKGVRGT
jgi:hypothetical protein